MEFLEVSMNRKDSWKIMEGFMEIYGKFMESSWKSMEIHGNSWKLMESPWKIHGKFMESSWKGHGNSWEFMESSWKIHGKLMESSWKVHGDSWKFMEFMETDPGKVHGNRGRTMEASGDPLRRCRCIPGDPVEDLFQAELGPMPTLLVTSCAVLG